jgi:hypothetical protein
VITEFHAGDTDATMHAMAAEILRYWHVMIQLADSVFVGAGRSVVRTLGPGPAAAAEVWHA